MARGTPIRRALILRPQVARRGGIALLSLLLAVFGCYSAWVAPLSARVYYDPAMAYMLSSLAWFRGAAYRYIDHPGTPVEVLGTILLALTYPFTAHAPDAFVQQQLAHPEHFLGLAQSVIVLASIAVCGLLAAKVVEVLNVSRAVLGVGLAGLFFVIHPSAFRSLATWSHDSFCFPAGTLLSFALLTTVRRETRTMWLQVFGLGFATGVLMSIQLYFAAWVIGTALALGINARTVGLSWVSSALRSYGVLVAAVAGFITATLPIRDSYEDFVLWLWRLASHDGIYGHGAEGAPSLGLLMVNLSDLVRQVPLLFVALAATLLLLVWRLARDQRNLRRDAGLWSAGLGLAVQALVALLLVAKHPGERYLLPVAATAPVLLAALFPKAHINDVHMNRLGLAIGTAALAGFVLSFVSAMTTHAALADAMRQDESTVDAWLGTLAASRGEDRDALHVLWTYGTTSRCYGLWFGDHTSAHVMRSDISQQCPNQDNLDIWQATVVSSAGQSPLTSSSIWDVAVIPEGLARSFPAALPEGAAHVLLTRTPGYGNLELIVRPSSRVMPL